MSGVGGESVHLRRSSTTATTTGSSKSSLNISKSVSPTGNKAVSPMSSPNSLQSGATPTIAQLQSLLKQQQQPNHSITTNNNNNKSVSVEIDDLKSQLQHSNINDTFNEDEEIEEVTDEVIINHDYHSSEDEYEDDEDEDENNNSVNNNSNNNSNNNNNNNTSISSAHSCESIAEEEELTASPILSRQYSYTIGHGTKPDVVLSIGGGFHSSPRSNRSESTIVHEDDLTNQNDKVINAKDKISSDYKRMMEDPEAFRNEKLKQRKSKFFTKKDLEEIPFNPSSGTQLRSTLFQQFMNEKIQMISENPDFIILHIYLKMGKKWELALRILVIIVAICLIGLTVPFWIYLKWAADKETYSSVAVFVVSAVILLILAALGIIGSIKRSKILLLYFSIINIIMLLFGIAQIIVTNVVDCENDPDNSFSFLCSNSEGAYYAPMILLLAVNLCGAVFGLILRYVIVHDTKGNYY